MNREKEKRKKRCGCENLYIVVVFINIISLCCEVRRRCRDEQNWYECIVAKANKLVLVDSGTISLLSSGSSGFSSYVAILIFSARNQKRSSPHIPSVTTKSQNNNSPTTKTHPQP